MAEVRNVGTWLVYIRIGDGLAMGIGQSQPRDEEGRDGVVHGTIGKRAQTGAKRKAGIEDRKNSPFRGPKWRAWMIDMGCGKTPCDWGVSEDNNYSTMLYKLMRAA